MVDSEAEAVTASLRRNSVCKINRFATCHIKLLFSVSIACIVGSGKGNLHGSGPLWHDSSMLLNG